MSDKQGKAEPLQVPQSAKSAATASHAQKAGGMGAPQRRYEFPKVTQGADSKQPCNYQGKQHQPGDPSPRQGEEALRSQPAPERVISVLLGVAENRGEGKLPVCREARRTDGARRSCVSDTAPKRDPAT